MIPGRLLPAGVTSAPAFAFAFTIALAIALGPAQAPALAAATPPASGTHATPRPVRLPAPTARALAEWFPRPEWRLLRDAQRRGDLDAIQALIDANPGLAQAQHAVSFEPLLTWAAIRNASQLLNSLLGQGALDWEQTTNLPPRTPALAAASLAGRTQAVATLLKAGAPPDLPDGFTRLPPIALLLAAWTPPAPMPGLPPRTPADTEAVARLLLDAGANILVSPPGHEELLFLPHGGTGPSPGLEFILTHAHPQAQRHPLGFNLLHAATLGGATNALAVLLARNFDPNATNLLGDSPLRALASTHPLGRSPHPFESFDPAWSQTHRSRRLPDTLRQTLSRQLLAAGARHDVFSAAGLGDLPALRALLDADASRLQARDSRGNTPLHWALLGDDVPAALALIRLGAPLAATNALGLTPLHLSLTGWRKETTLTLLDAQAPLDLPDLSGRAPLALATHAPEAVSLLLQHGAPPNGPGSRPPLPEAALHLIHDLRALPFQSTSALNSRTLEFREAPVRALLRAGALPTTPGPEGRSTLDLALSHAALNLLELLIDHGADLNAPDPDGNPAWFTALHAPPIAPYHPPIPWQLRAAQLLPDWIATPLSRRTWMPEWPPVLRIPVVPALANFGAQLTATNRTGQNALHHIASLGPRNPFDTAPTNSLAALLDAGLAIDARDSEGFTPWLRAWRHGALRFALTLERHGASTTTTNLAGENALHLAVRAAAESLLHFPSVLPTLQKFPLVPSTPDASGLTPADLARSLELPAVADLLSTPPPTPTPP